jgi:hypothetical protein
MRMAMPMHVDSTTTGTVDVFDCCLFNYLRCPVALRWQGQHSEQLFPLRLVVL